MEKNRTQILQDGLVTGDTDTNTISIISQRISIANVPGSTSYMEKADLVQSTVLRLVILPGQVAAVSRHCLLRKLRNGQKNICQEMHTKKNSVK